MNRKQRREMKRKLGEEKSQKLAEKIFQFDKLPDACLTCEKSFDKKSKEMARTWNVVVQDKDTVRLYCPECWKIALDIIDKLKKEKENVSV